MPDLEQKTKYMQRVGLTLFFCLFLTIAYAAIPQVGTISPSSGTSSPNQPVTFTTAYSDTDGVSDIRYAYFLANTTGASINGLCVVYDQVTNKLYLRNEANTAWLGGGVIPGSNIIIENSYAKLDCLNTTILKSENQLTVRWRVIFKSSFLGNKNTYLYAIDKSGIASSTVWIQKGSWSIVIPPNNPPVINSLIPANRSRFINGDTVNISLNAFDADADTLQYRYLIDANIIKDWTTSPNFTLTAGAQLLGRHTIKVEVKDTKAAVVSKSADIYIFRAFPKPAG